MGVRVLKLIKKSPIHPSFLLLFLWFVFTKNIVSFFLFVSVVLTHEYGHYFVAKRLGYKLNSFFLAPYGACLNYKEKAFEFKDEIKIALAGPCVNLSLCMIVVVSWWIFPSVYNFTYEFVNQSFSLALFNFLPCYPLDGGRVFVGILSNFKPRNWAIKVTQGCNIAISILLLILFFISCFINFNPTLCLCGCFLMFGVFESKNESKYQPSFLYQKKIKNFSKPFFVCLNSTLSLSDALKHIESNRFTVFIVIFSNSQTKMIDEENLKSLALKYSINSTFDEIYIKKLSKM